jgi:1-acyl-sn-glycerol-3-phosphate acyltransferase
MTNEEANRFAREKGVSRPLYAVVRAILIPFMRLWFRVRIVGAEHIPKSGPVIVTPNHKSFSDSFFIAMGTRRHVRFMGKSELFEGRFGGLLLRLGAFPVRRGQSDEEALETARTVLRQEGLLALFPEGTRVRDPEGLGTPKRGATRLALETGAPIVPAAISGTAKLRVGPIVLPQRVQVSFSEPIPVSDMPATPEAAGELLEDAVWPEVERQHRELLSNKGLIVAGLAALGAGALASGARRRRKKR